MSIYSPTTFEQKEKWLLRPISIAGSIAWFAGFFGFVYYYFELLNHETIIMALIASLAVTAGLLIWGIARVQRIVRRQY